MVVEDRHPVVAKRHSDGREFISGEPVTVLLRGQIVRQETGVAGGFGQAISMPDLYAKPIFEARGGILIEEADEGLVTDP